MRKSLYGLGGFAALAAAWLGPRGEALAVAVEAPLVGVSVPSKKAAVAAEQAGKIIEMPVVEGSRIAKDDVLFRLSSRLEELEVERLRPLAESDFIQQRARKALELAEQQGARVRDLRDKQITSDKELQAQVFEVEVARLKLTQAGIEQAQAKNEFAQAVERLAQRTVRSPFTGVVTERMKGEGESIEKFVPVIEVMCLDPLWIEFDCPLTEERRFAKGTEIEVAPSQRPADVRRATVQLLSVKAAAASHTFVVRAEVPNPDLSWKAGLKMLIHRPAADDVPSRPGK